MYLSNTYIYLSFSQAVSPHGVHHPCFYVQHPIIHAAHAAVSYPTKSNMLLNTYLVSKEFDKAIALLDSIIHLIRHTKSQRNAFHTFDP